MKETTVPKGYTNTGTYILLVGDKALEKDGIDEAAAEYLENITKEMIKTQTELYKTYFQEEESDYDEEESDYGYDKYAVFLIDQAEDQTENQTEGQAEAKAVAIPDIATYGIMNISTVERKAILKKTNTTYIPLEDAEFEILRYDRTATVWNEGQLTRSGAGGVFFIGNLPYGYYYLHETGYPQGVQGNGEDGWWYTIKVDDEGITYVGPNQPSETPYDPADQETPVGPDDPETPAGPAGP